MNYQTPEGIYIRTVDVNIENYPEKALEMERNNEADVIVAGANTREVRNIVNLPVVNIEISGFDLLSTIKKAGVDKRPKEKIGVVSYKNKMAEFSNIKDILTVDIVEATYNDLDDLEVKLARLKRQGISKVIGTTIVMEKAEKLNMESYVIYNMESVRRAFDNAVAVVLAKREETRKARFLKTIFEKSYSGIIVTDEKGYISEVNPLAESLLEKPQHELLGKNIQSFFTDFSIQECIRCGYYLTNQIFQINNMKVLVNAEAAGFDTSENGFIITFQNIDIIQKSERAIRRNLSEKGFVAKAAFDDIIGKSEKIKTAKREAKLFARGDSTVLLLGQTGVGKDMFAQAIHNASQRMSEPFIAINCAALSSQLLQSELFGYAEGSFTGAKKGGKAGIFEMGNKGTVFLDEIGEIDASTQVLLLRVLETGAVMRIGGEKFLPIDVRIIAATNRNLWGMVESGLFREDLYYRLCVLEVKIPPLKDRKEDIPLFVLYFLKKFYGNLPEPLQNEIANDKVFMDYNWKGNIRELRNVIERFSVVYDETQDYRQMLHSMIYKGVERNEEETENIEIAEIEEALREAQGSRQLAAERLGISRTTLWRRMKELR